MDDMETYYLRMCGIEPEWYYKNSLRNVSHKAKNWENDETAKWERARYISYSVYRTAYGFSGKPIFQKIKEPTDLFSLPNDPIGSGENEIINDPNQQMEYLKMLTQ